MKPHLRKIVGHSPCMPMSGVSSESKLMCNANVESVELQDKGNSPCCEAVSETDVAKFIPEDYIENYVELAFRILACQCISQLILHDITLDFIILQY